MDTLSSLHSILSSLNQAVLDDSLWPETSALIDEACGSRGNGLVVGEGDGDDVRIHFSRLLFRGERRQDLERTYFEVYHPHDEAMPRLRELPDSHLVRASDLYTEKEKKTSAVYNEGLPRLCGRECLRARFGVPDGLRTVWSLASPCAAGGWQSDQVQRAQYLLPHIRQFVRIRHTLAGAGALGCCLTHLLDNRRIGVIQLDRCGRIVEANTHALDLLRGRTGLYDCDGALRAGLPADDGRLQGLLRKALPGNGELPRGGSMTVQCALGRARLGLHVNPVDGDQRDIGGRLVAALVLVVDLGSHPCIDPGWVSTMFDLSPSESRVTALLAEGKSVRDISAITHYQESYVRWLLKRVYRKQGLSGQVALVRRVLTLNALP